MSVQLLGKAFYADLPSHLKLTLLALCDEANDEGRGVFIGQKRLALKCGTSERSVRTNLGLLVDRGWLSKLPDRHPDYATNQYEVIVDRLPDRPATSSGGAERPEVQRQSDRKSSVDPTGSGLPTTRELPVSRSTQELALASSSRWGSTFDEFWDVYPRSHGKAPAKKAWATAIKRAQPWEIIRGASMYRTDPNREEAYTAHAATWLNQQRWNDPPLPSRERPRRVGQSGALLRLAMEDD